MAPKRFLPAILANLSAALSEILLMASAAWLIASASLKIPISALSIGITLVRTAGIARAVLRYADRFFSHKIIFKLLDDLRGELFLRAAKLLPLKSGRSHEGELLHTLIISADLIKNLLPRVILPLSTATFVTILLTYFLRAPIPIILLLILIFSALININQPDDSDYREKLLDFSDGRDELQIFGSKPAIKTLNKAADDFGAQNFNLTARQINFDAAIRIFIAAALFFILLKLSAVVDKISLTVWALIFLATLEILAQIPDAIRTLKKIREIRFPDKKILPAQVSSTDKAVEIKNLSFGYGGEKIFDEFNLIIERGEKILIVGESGAGKTTLLYLLTKLFAPDSGSISLGGTISASTSTNYIFSASIRRNFEMLHEKITDEEILNALTICGLENFNIDVPIGEDGANLSGGERTRLQIALAVASKSEILILDEPTAGLDKICAENLIKNLLEEENRTLIIITHDSNYFSDFRRVWLVH